MATCNRCQELGTWEQQDNGKWRLLDPETGQPHRCRSPKQVAEEIIERVITELSPEGLGRRLDEELRSFVLTEVGALREEVEALERTLRHQVKKMRGGEPLLSGKPTDLRIQQQISKTLGEVHGEVD